MRPITSKVEKAISMFVIFSDLHFIYEMANHEKYYSSRESYPQCVQRRFIRHEIAHDSNTHDELAYIIAILGEVVYLLFIHHGDMIRATDVPEGGGWRNVLIYLGMSGCFAKNAGMGCTG